MKKISITLTLIMSFVLFAFVIPAGARSLYQDTETPTATATETPTITSTPTITQTPTAVAITPEGGGQNAAFPWAAGKAMMMGVRGVHGSGDYGTVGMLFIDWVSGPDMGPNAAGPTIYASTAGKIYRYCKDSYSVAVNLQGSEYFVYAHLMDNSNLTTDHEFAQGEAIGVLRPGGFCLGSPRPAGCKCGWAEQSQTHYHIHWGFAPKNGIYCIESWCLDVANQVWKNGSGKTVGVGGWMIGGGGSGNGYDDPILISETGANSGYSPTQPRLFDNILIALGSIITGFLGAALPKHDATTTLPVSIVNAAIVVVRIFYILLKSNFNMLIPMVVFGVIFVMETARLIYAVWRLVLKAIPMAN